MKEFTEPERQLLIAAGWLKSRYGLMAGIAFDCQSSRENLEKFGRVWFGQYFVDWADAYQSLTGEGFLSEAAGEYSLTEKGGAASKIIETASPLWLYEYNNFFARAAKIRAHALFCEEVYGKNLCQHGLADMFQLNLLLEVLNLTENDRVLDLGCGNGLITEYLQDQTGAFFEGVDLSDEAIRQARSRTAAEVDRLTFKVGNMNRLDFDRQTFTGVISIDALYYVNDLEETFRQMLSVLKPAGQMGIFYTQWINRAEDRAQLLAENTGLAVLLKKYDLSFSAFDLTKQEAGHWRKKVTVLEQLKPEFEREGNLALYDYRYSEAVRYAGWDAKLRSRFLYHVRCP